MLARVIRSTTGLALSLAALSSVALADESVSWNFDVATEGEDVFWTSPTLLDPGAPRYWFGYELTQVIATVQWSFLTLDVDVTDQIPPEQRVGSQVVDGPLPIVALDAAIVYPEPPEPPALVADVFMQIDAAGFGQLSMTNITLGETEVDLGPPFGFQTVTILGFRVVGTLDGEIRGPAGDVNGDGNVDFGDLLEVLSAWGDCPAPPAECPADTNGDGIIDFTDLLRVLSEWG